MQRHAWQLLGLALASVWLCTGRAWGYVRELTSTGQPIALRSPCASMQLSLDTPPPVLTLQILLHLCG